MPNAKPVITFVNHASVLIANGRKAVLSDPWYFGSAFHQGWRLLVETPMSDILSLLDNTDYIWLSHEYADHFSPEFFRHPQVRQKILDRGIRVLFQTTRDRRVAEFLSRNGYEVLELKEGQRFSVDVDFQVAIQKCGFRDSALIASIGARTLYNLNDCSNLSAAALGGMKTRYGACDLLLTQFSYASWKGGRGNDSWRKQAAREKIETMIRQAQLLEAKRILPFASFFYFANEMNAYLNDAVNTPQVIGRNLHDVGLECIFMRPMQTKGLDELAPDKDAAAWWQHKMSNIDSLPKLRYRQSFDLDAMREAFAEHQQRIFSRNSKILIRLLSWLPFLNAFRGAYIRLTDIDCQVVHYSIFTGLTEVDVGENTPIVAMHSSSFHHILKYDYGFGALGVSGCFETVNKGFEALAKNLALERLNGMGLTLSSALFFRPDLILRFFRMLKTVERRTN